jgi:crotonobetainyl-CoA:carnitine CoA-transferase CaiB-like acyl-CoA transferase
VQAETGLSSITGNEHGAARVGVSVCDIAAGMTAFQGIMQSLFARERSGEGRHVAVSLYHALADWMNVPYLQFAYGGKTPERAGLHHPTIAPYGAYRCGDGKSVLISIQNEREWAALCEEVLGDAAIAIDPRFGRNSKRVENRDVLDQAIGKVFSAFSREEIVERLERARVAYGRVSTLEDVANHPQNRYIEVETPGGPVRCLAPGAIFDGELPEFAGVPAPDQHGASIRAEFSAPAKSEA